MTHLPALRLTTRPLRAALAAGCLATLLLGGCTDPALERQQEVQRELESLGADYAAALASTPDVLSAEAGEAALSTVRAIASRANGLSGGTGAQSEIARKIAASASRTAAGIALARASMIESSAAAMRGVALEAAALAADLDALAAAVDGSDFGSVAATARAERDAAAGAVGTSEQEIAMIDQPLGALSRAIADGSTRLSGLEQEIAVLLRKARDSNPANAFAFVEEASAVRADARDLRSGIEEASIDASGLELAKSLVSTRLAGFEGIQAAAEKAGELVAQVESDAKASAASARALATELRTQSAAIAAAIAEERSGMLDALYSAAESDLASAQSGDSTLRHALTTDALRLDMTKLSGLGSHGRMQAALGTTDGDLRASAEAAITAFRERASAAADEFSMLGDDPTVATMKRFVDDAKAYADGLSLATLMDPPASTASGRSSSRSNRSTGGSSANPSGADSNGPTPDEIIAAFVSFGDDDKAAMAYAISLADDSTATGRSMKKVMESLAEPQAALIAAMREQFGDDATSAGALGGMPLLSPSILSGLAKSSETADTVTYSSTDAEGSLTFVKRGGAWKIDFLAPLAGQMPPEMLEQMAPMIAQMMTAMVPAMKQALSDFETRILSGEFSSAEEAAQALTQAMAAMQQGGAGLGR